MMLQVLLLLAFGRLQETVYEDARAWQWAAAYAALTLLIGIATSPPAGALIGATVSGLYAWGYFALLRQVTDNLLLWLTVFIGGAVLPLLALTALTTSASA